MVEDDFEWQDLPPSKSAIKREMTALQDLGTRLTQLPDAQLKQMPIDDEQLLEAIQLARRIKARGGLRRQLQFIGKLMRAIDPTPIEEAFARLDGQHEEQKARFHRLETLRDALLSNSDSGMQALLSAFPNADRQHVRQLVRSYAAELKNGNPQARPVNCSAICATSMSMQRKNIAVLRKITRTHSNTDTGHSSYAHVGSPLSFSYFTSASSD